MVRQLNEATTYDNDGKVLQTTVTTIPKAESSVEVTTNSKGEAQLTVKVYSEDVKIALATCLAMYEEGLLQIEVIKAKMQGLKSVKDHSVTKP